MNKEFVKNGGDNVDSDEVKKLFYDNEIESNLLVARINLIFAILVFTYLILIILRVLGEDVYEAKQVPILTAIVIINITNSIITFIYKGENDTLKFVDILSLIFSIILCSLLFSYAVTLLMVLPVVLSSRYFLKWFTRTIAVITGVLWFASTYIGEVTGIAWIDLNYYELPVGTIIKVLPPSLYDSIVAVGINVESRIGLMWTRFFIALSFYIVISIVSVGLAECGRKLIYKMANERLEKMHLSAELNVASKIQLDMLPNSFDLKPKKDEFTLSASMTPAKEVGGDFYDFFYVDENHLALIIADVSGKGVPAALFMANAKTTIKNITLNSSSKTTSSVLGKANNALCTGNEEGYFVTVWMGIIDIRTGKGIATNAGHENPIIKRSGKKFEVVKYKHSMALGVFPDAKFEEHEFNLYKDDKLIVYTDGIPEAINNENEQFGEERMIEALNSNLDNEESPQKTIDVLKNATTTFADGAKQFDDITILCYEQKKTI